jgi:hypothetical protein
MRSRAAHLAIATMLAASVPAAAARAGDSTPGCIDGSANQAAAAGGDAGPPRFASDFFRTTFSLDVSTDGFSRRDLAISIEAVCGVPKAYAVQAAQLAGSDGVAVITSRTRVYNGKSRVKPARRHSALDGADTMHLTVRLWHPAHWRPGEDNRVPTFTTTRAVITD